MHARIADRASPLRAARQPQAYDARAHGVGEAGKRKAAVRSLRE
jgi:hypothetical protein